MTVGILAEKPSAARNVAKALGGMAGTFEGTPYIITAARGHLYEYKQPDQQVAADLAVKYKSWDLANLPWDLSQLSWVRGPRRDAEPTISKVQGDLSAVTEIVCATDVDPSGEGGLIFGEIIEELGLGGKKLSRMYFTDESEKELQKAFRERKDIASIDDFDEMRMATCRTQWDFLSIQFSRVASVQANHRTNDNGVPKMTVVRQGRLKSAMTLLVGDGLKAYNDYVKKPFFAARFKDDLDVVYSRKDEERFDKKEDVDLTQLSASTVTVDSKEMKRKSPPRLLDLAGLSSILSGRGVKADVVLKVYQRLYEAQIVSYPRTEDRIITSEQHAEMLPKIDQIAQVVGVDPSILTHRLPRKTHVKTGGAHGANRPGVNVPASLDALEITYGREAVMIYELLARNYLAMHAEDYEYEQQKGHVTDYPEFMGLANVPRAPGWKAVFAEGADDDDADASAQGLGSSAEPFVHEGANQRPPHPTMTWLMKQLEKREVGTGATRTSTYANISKEGSRGQIFSEKRGKITMTEVGNISYLMLPNTKIGDLNATERLTLDMKAVARGQKSSQEVLGEVADMVRHDIDVMGVNAKAMRKALGLKDPAPRERVSGTWAGQEVVFNRIWSGHRFTDEELEDLLAGAVVTITATSARTGKDFTVKGALGEKEYKGKMVVGFQLDFTDDVPDSWAQHVFTDVEKDTLRKGGTVHISDAVSKNTGNKFECDVMYGVEKGSGSDRKKIIPNFSTDELSVSYLGHVFTDDERERLERGETVLIDGYTSKKGNVFSAKTTFDADPKGGKKINFHFDSPSGKKTPGKGKNNGGATRGRKGR